MRNLVFVLLLAFLIVTPAMAQDAGSVSGTVFDTNRNLIAGAFVLIVTEDSLDLHTQTGRDGSFFFDEVPAGWCMIFAQFQNLEVEEHILVIEDQNTVVNLILEDRGGGNDNFGTVSGAVFDPNFEIVAGAFVQIAIDDSLALQTQTGQDGSFFFDEVPIGFRTISAEFQNLEAEERFEVIANQNTVINLFLEDNGGNNDRFGSVSGVVVNTDREPVAGALVQVALDDSLDLHTRSGRDGFFTINEVPVGWRIITAVFQDLEAEERVEIIADQDTFITLILEEQGGGNGRFGSVSGTIFNSNREVVAGAVVHIESNDSLILRTQTDEDGSFFFEEVPIGWWIITARLQELEAFDRIQVIADQNTEVNLILEERGGGNNHPGIVNGIVLTMDNTPVDSALICFWVQERERPVCFAETFSGLDGAFNLYVPPGDYHVTAEHFEFGVAETDIEVVECDTLFIELVLEAGELDPYYSSVDEMVDLVPISADVISAFPNPFNPTTTVNYNLLRAGNVQLSVFNETGQKVQTLINGYRPSGVNQVLFNGHSLPNGTYILRLDAGGQTSAFKVLLIK